MKYLLTAGKFCKRKEETKKTLDELYSYASNIRRTNEFIENYEIALELNKTGLLLMPHEAYERAQKTSKKWIDCDFIRNGLILKGIVEGMNDEIKRANLSF